jgi:hypothetical protein
MAEMTQTQDLEAAVTLGEQTVQFLQGPVGKYLTQRAEEVEREALEALANVSPYEPDAIRKLQNQVWVANSVVGWLQEAIEAAVQAHRQLEDEERLPDHG